MVQYTDDELIDALKRAAGTLGRTPSKDEMESMDGLPSVWTYQHRFGSWSAALERAGIRPRQAPARTRYSDEELIAAIRRAADELGKAPTMKEMALLEGVPSPLTFRDRFGSWTSAIKAAGLEPNVGPGRSRFTDEELIAAIRRFAQELGRSPLAKELAARDGAPSPHTYVYRFGSWTTALERAGLKPRHGPGPKYTDEELASLLRRAAGELGRTPKTTDMNSIEDMPSVVTFIKRFGSWRSAVRSAGLEANVDPRCKRYTEEELVSHLRSVAEELGRTPAETDIVDKKNMASVVTYRKRFGSWKNALAAAGLTTRRKKERKKRKGTPLSDDEMLAALKEAAEVIGRLPSMGDIAGMNGIPPSSAYCRRFGSWTYALEAAGLRGAWGKERYADGELIRLLRAAARKLGGTPRERDLRGMEGVPSSSTYRKHFGSWGAALRRAGLDPGEPITCDGDAPHKSGKRMGTVDRVDRGRGSARFTDEDLLGYIRTAADTLGRAPMMKDLRALDGYPNPGIYWERFGSWVRAVMLAGLTPARRGPYTEEELIDYLRDLGDRLGRRPSPDDISRTRGAPSRRTFQVRFGSWTNALKMAGFTPRTGRLKGDELLGYLRKAADELGRAPRRIDLKRMDGYPPPSQYQRTFGSWTEALRQAGLPAPPRPLPNEKMVVLLKAAARDLGRVPTLEDMHGREGCPHPGTFRHRFGSWPKALRAAGLIPPERSYTDGELIALLQSAEERLARSPTKRAFDAIDGYPRSGLYVRRFGSWEEALRSAGCETRKLRYTDDELVGALCQAGDELGRVPTRDELDALKGYPGSHTYVSRFGSWDDALRAAGYRPPKRGYTDDELLRALKRAAKRLGRTPRVSDMDAMADLPGHEVYRQRFGSWVRSLELAGLEVEHVHQYSHEELVSHLREIADEVGRKPRSTDLRGRKGRPDPATYLKEFGTWQNALLGAGLIDRKRGMTLIDKQEQRVIAVLDAGPRTLDEIALDGNMDDRTAWKAVSALCRRGIAREVKPKRRGAHVRYDTVDEKLNEVLEREHKVFDDGENERTPEETRSDRIKRIIAERHGKREDGSKR